MRISFFHRLFFSLLLTSGLLLAGMSLLINAGFKDGLQNYLNREEIAKAELLAAQVADYYSQSYGWRRMRQAPYLWAGLIRQLGEQPPPRDLPHPPRHAPALNPARTQTSALVPLSVRLNLLNADGDSVLGRPENLTVQSPDYQLQRVPIMLKDQRIGWVSVLQSKQISGPLAESFLYSQSRNIFTITVAALVISLIFAFALVSYLLKPLKALHRGAQRVAQGDLDYRIQQRGNHEVTDVIDEFNQLVETLKRQKQMREQWLSDISHELRTPLAVLRSELEAIQDGIRPMNPEYIDSLHRQVLNLGKLVDDLYALSVSDAGAVTDFAGQPVDVAGLLSDVTESFSHRLREKNIRLVCDADRFSPLWVNGDTKQLRQLFHNLLENSFRYTDDGGEVQVSVSAKQPELIHLLFADSPPGVPDVALPKLFDRLYRVDKSRSRANGGSGLGLAICSNIVAQHGGSIVAQHASLGGVQIIVKLPCDHGRSGKKDTG